MKRFILLKTQNLVENKELSHL